MKRESTNSCLILLTHRRQVCMTSGVSLSGCCRSQLHVHCSYFSFFLSNNESSRNQNCPTLRQACDCDWWCLPHPAGNSGNVLGISLSGDEPRQESIIYMFILSPSFQSVCVFTSNTQIPFDWSKTRIGHRKVDLARRYLCSSRHNLKEKAIFCFIYWPVVSRSVLRI